MKNLAPAIFLMLHASYAVSADFKSDDSKMKTFKLYAAVAGAAGSAAKCGIANVEPEEVFTKMSCLLRRRYDEGQISAEDGEVMMRGIARTYDKALQVKPTVAMCEAGRVLVTSFLELEDC